MSSLRFKRVLVTGAARGIGKELARRCAVEGAEVVLTDRDADALDATREELAAAGGRCSAFPLDVTDGAAIDALKERLHAEAGTVDVLINNAGVVFGGPFLDVPLADHRTTLRVNVEGVVAMTHAFLPDLLASPRGHAVFMASASGFVALPNGATYAASKWAVIGFAESLRLELKRQRRRNVDLTIVCPTYVATGMFEGARPPRSTHMLDPEALADKVVEAVERRKLWVLEPWLVKVTPFLHGALPTPVADLLSDAFGASGSMEGWKGAGR